MLFEKLLQNGQVPFSMLPRRLALPLLTGLDGCDHIGPVCSTVLLAIDRCEPL